MDKENVIHIHFKIYLCTYIKCNISALEEKILPFITWMELKDAILIEISQTQKV
jgi:hypothetical protein